jgi:hypothetical protein
MAFINKLDLIQFAILEDELTEITRNDDVIVTACCSAAIAEMKVYLNDSYDVDTIFTRTGSARHQLLLQLGVDMAVWMIVSRCQAGINLDDRQARYDRAIKTLKAFQKTETYGDLPRREQPLQKHINFKANPKRGNYF